MGRPSPYGQHPGAPRSRRGQGAPSGANQAKAYGEGGEAGRVKTPRGDVPCCHAPLRRPSPAGRPARDHAVYEGCGQAPTTCAYRTRTACRGVPVAAGAPTCGTPSAGRPRHHRPPRGGERRALIRRCGRRPPTARLPPARSPPYGLSRTVRPAAPPGRSSAVRPDAPANWRSPCGYRPSGTPGTSARVKDQPSRTDGQPRRCPKEFATALTGFPLTPTESLRTRR